jgi:anti-anti-sigma factor
MGAYSISTSRIADDVYAVRAAGVVGLHAAPQLKKAFLALVERGERLIVADLSGAAACDSTTLGILLGVDARVAAAGGAFAVVCGAALAPMVHCTALDELLGVCRSLDEAVAALTRDAAAVA